MRWTDMLVQGGLVSAEWQQEAWDALLAGDLSPGNLEQSLRCRGPREGRDAPVPENRSDNWYMQEIANRMRQQARKAGAIKLEGKPRKWVFVQNAFLQRISP